MFFARATPSIMDNVRTEIAAVIKARVQDQEERRRLARRLESLTDGQLERAQLLELLETADDKFDYITKEAEGKHVTLNLVGSNII